MMRRPASTVSTIRTVRMIQKEWAAVKWEDVLIEYMKNKKTGKCPVCGENALKAEHYKKSLTFECKKCGAFRHYDGLSTEEESNGST